MLVLFPGPLVQSGWQIGVFTTIVTDHFPGQVQSLN